MEKLNQSDQIKLVLKALNLTQTGLADKLCLSQSVISEFASGSREPSKEFLLGLPKMGISLDWFLFGLGDMYLTKQMAKYEFTPRIRQLRNILNLDQIEFAKKLHIPHNTIIDYEDGGAVPSSFIDKLKTVFSVNTNWFINGIGEPFILPTGKNQIPVFQYSSIPEGSFVVPLLDQRLAAGSGSLLPEEDEVTALVQVPAYLSHYGNNIAALTVDGDSMYPTLRRGDMIVCDSCGWSGDGIYALRMSGSGIVKRLTKSPGKIIIISDNPKYPQREEPEESEDIQIIGRVHCAITKIE